MTTKWKEKKHLLDKRQELVWALSHQGYSQTEMSIIFHIDRSMIHRIVEKMPDGWTPKWVKIV